MEILTHVIDQDRWYDEDGRSRVIVGRKDNCLIEDCGGSHVPLKITRTGFRYGKLRVYEVEEIILPAATASNQDE